MDNEYYMEGVDGYEYEENKENEDYIENDTITYQKELIAIVKANSILWNKKQKEYNNINKELVSTTIRQLLECRECVILFGQMYDIFGQIFVQFQMIFQLCADFRYHWWNLMLNSHCIRRAYDAKSCFLICGALYDAVGCSVNPALLALSRHCRQK
ncbi:unnamed protein product [Lasius platythorax]|uniref:Uncharacterized protein n=1 Tax=Lasius platythorax TaxID=488582 RepID=A0AAV2NJ46_9HYME